jgi:hypothetical protein
MNSSAPGWQDKFPSDMALQKKFSCRLLPASLRQQESRLPANLPVGENNR